MAKVYYVVEKGDDYSQVNFYQTEKEALKFGRSNIPDFEMGEEPMNDEEEDGDEFFNGDELTFNKGIMYTVQDGEVTIEAIDEDDAKEKAQALDEYSVAMFFDGFTEGMYGYQGTAADGKGYKWVWDGYDISESNTSSTKNKMKMQINEIKRMQQLAGLVKEGYNLDHSDNIEEYDLNIQEGLDYDNDAWDADIEQVGSNFVKKTGTYTEEELIASGKKALNSAKPIPLTGNIKIDTPNLIKYITDACQKAGIELDPNKATIYSEPYGFRNQIDIPVVSGDLFFRTNLDYEEISQYVSKIVVDGEFASNKGNKERFLKIVINDLTNSGQFLKAAEELKKYMA